MATAAIHSTSSRLICYGWLGLSCLAAPSMALAQSLNNLDNMAFGVIDYNAQPPTGTARLGPNGSIAYSGNLDGDGSGTAARIEMVGTTGDTVEVRCSASATLARSGGGTLAFDVIKISHNIPQSYSAATDCAGLTTTVLNPVLSATASENILYLGGQLNPDGNNVGGTFRTNISGGAPFKVRVVFP